MWQIGNANPENTVIGTMKNIALNIACCRFAA
jgi:hypothetical protein